MKKLIATLLILISASFAYAITPYEYCGRMSSAPRYAISCFEFVKSCKYLDDNALAFCNDFNEITVMSRCLVIIENKTYQEDALGVCKKVEAPWDSYLRNEEKLNCLSVIANKQYSDEAINLCGEIQLGKGKIDCLERLSGPICNYNNRSCRK